MGSVGTGIAIQGLPFWGWKPRQQVVRCAVVPHAHFPSCLCLCACHPLTRYPFCSGDARYSSGTSHWVQGESRALGNGRCAALNHLHNRQQASSIPTGFLLLPWSQARSSTLSLQPATRHRRARDPRPRPRPQALLRTLPEHHPPPWVTQPPSLPHPPPLWCTQGQPMSLALSWRTPPHTTPSLPAPTRAFRSSKG